MKNIKGITLISLVVTILVLLILASIGTYSGIEVIKSSKFTAFTTEMEIMQTQINSIYQNKDDNKTEIGTEITGSVKTQADKVFTETESGITSQDGYRYWSNETIKGLGIEGVNQDFFVNIEKRSVVSYKGFEYEGKTYYTLNQLPDSLYNVEYENPNIGKPTFEVTTSKQGANKWKIEIANIEYENGYIDKWQVKYKLEGLDYWNTSDDLSFVINSAGVYTIKLVNGDIQSDEVEEVVASEYVSDGLIVHYDAINNTGEGDDKHSTTTTVWKDLSGNDNDGTLNGFSNTEESGWQEDRLVFDGEKDYVAKTGITIDGSNGTVEIIAKAISGMYMFRSDASGARTYISKVRTGKGNPDVTTDFVTNDTSDLSSRVLKWYTIDGQSSFVNYYNTVKSEEKNFTSTDNGTYISIGSFLNTTAEQLAKMEVYAVRVYNRVLTDAEVKMNYKIDKERFGL
jgi:Tfp pilus assembly major pilin PilA